MSPFDLLILTASFVVSLVIATWGAWSNAKAYYAMKWEREIAPGVKEKARNEGVSCGYDLGLNVGERIGYNRGFSAGRAAMVRHYAEQTMDRTAQRIVAQIMNRN